MKNEGKKCNKSQKMKNAEEYFTNFHRFHIILDKLNFEINRYKVFSRFTINLRDKTSGRRKKN